MKKEKHYLVRWEMDEFESNPLIAIKKAIEALPHERNEETIATVFEVDEIIDGKVVKTFQIDTLEEGCNPFTDDVENFKENDYLFDKEKNEAQQEQEYKDFKRCAD